MKEITIKVEGMVCNGCENRVENALKTIKGVKNVVANYNSGTVAVTFNKKVSLDDLKEKIIDIGFIVKEG